MNTNKRIIGYHISLNSDVLTVVNTDNQVMKAKLGDPQHPIIDFLLQNKGNSIKVFYHLGYSVACLLRFLEITKEQAGNLLETQKFDLYPYNFQHLPHKYFSIKSIYRDPHGDKPFSNFSDMSQFSPWFLSPNDDLREKAEEAKSKGEVFYKALTDLGLHPTTLTSPIRAFEKEILSKCDQPTDRDVPDEVAWAAYQCCHGGWLESYQKGHFEQTWDYDITSAYPYYVAQLIDHRFGSWLHTEIYGEKAIYGVAWCKVRIDSWFSPIIRNVTNLESYTPVGEWECWLTKGEIDFINQYKIGEVEILDGWWWLPDMKLGKVYRPLKKFIYRLNDRKNETEGLEKEVVKRIMTGMWGKLLSTTDDSVSDTFNPVWASYVESETRLSVARFILDNCLSDFLLSIAVDGVLVSHPTTALNGEGLGKWKLASECPALVIGSGVVAVQDKKNVAEFAMNYDDLLQRIKDQPDDAEYKQTKLSPVTLQKAVNGNMFDKLGQLIEITKTINVKYEQKRLYLNEPQCGGDLLNNVYESIPVDVSMLPIMDDEKH